MGFSLRLESNSDKRGRTEWKGHSFLIRVGNNQLSGDQQYITQCSGCLANIRISPEHIGLQGICPACGKSFAMTSARPIDGSVGPIAGSISSASKSGSGSTEVSGESGVTEESGESHREIGRFVLSRKLGEGGFGEVWLATDTTLDRKVAIKLPRFRDDDLKRQRRFVAEAKASASLRHPNIVPIFDAGEVDGCHYIATDYVRGTPLAKINANRPAPVIWSVGIVRKLAEAVHYAHQESIVHRDIKPDNVLVDRHGEPQLLDFGLAKNLDDDGSHTIDGTVLGTPAYMAPEQARGEVDRIGPPSDQYSLGVVLFRLLVGETPFRGSPMSVLQQVVREKSPSLAMRASHLPRDLISICDKARAEDPSDRYADCESMAEDCARFLRGDSVIARPLGRLAKIKRWSGKNRREAVLAAACLVLGPLMLVASGIGWASAAANAAVAARSEAEAREETNRVLDLEKRLERRVKEAAEARDIALAAKENLTEARGKLEREIQLLKLANDEVDEASANSKRAAIALKDDKKGVREKDTALKNAAVEYVLTQPKRISARWENVPRFEKISVVPEMKSDPTGNVFVCFWKGEVLRLRKAAEIKAKTTPAIKFKLGVGTVSLFPHIVDWSVQSDGTVVVSWRYIRKKTMVRFPGIGTVGSSGKISSVVPIYLAKSKGLPDLSNGALHSFNGHSAVGKSGEIYFTALETSGNALIRYLPATGSFQPLVRMAKSYDLDIYLHDPSGLYVLFHNRLERLELAGRLVGVALAKRTIEFQIPRPAGFIREIELLSSDEMLLCISNRPGGSQSSTLLLNRQSKTFHVLDRYVSGIAQKLDGSLVAENGRLSLSLIRE